MKEIKKECCQCGWDLTFSENKAELANDNYLCHPCMSKNTLGFGSSWLENFSSEEKFGNSWEYIDSHLLYMLQRVRTEIGKPFIIHCGYSVDDHSEDSWHYKGQAVDFHIEGTKLVEVGKILNVMWPGGMGTYPCWNSPGFHLDLGPKRRWFQNSEGKDHSISL